MGVKMNRVDFIESQNHILQHFGIENQIEKFFEEFAELKAAIESGKVLDIRSELADVHNLLLQLISYYGVSDVYEIAVEKLERTNQRIESGYYEVNK
jgi:NTP pyrophosphatase (non-canonical NTP hydrolase)